jgi:ribonuclease PH
MSEYANLKDLEMDLPFVRGDGRASDALRAVSMTLDYIPSALGSVLIECGKTRVICVASMEDKLPRWMLQEQNRTGWVTAEYSLLPYAGGTRKMREATAGKLSGRTQEIQRLIGRALRAAVDLKQLGDRTIWIDCDVIEADGGTRTASVTGGFVALYAALHRLVARNVIKCMPPMRRVAAVSVGIVENCPVLDLNYEEDFAAQTDFNIVMTDSGDFVELQGTAEENPFTSTQLQAMLALGEKGCQELLARQAEVLQSLA